MAAPRDEQLLSVGKQCSHENCHLVDFLPFKCNHCEAAFCQDHFMVSAHKCTKYDAAKFNRISPNCPFCNVVVAVKPSQDPNEAVEAHFTRDCSVLTGKAKARSTPVCAKARCGKTLFAPIRCTKCSQQFCAAHRFPADHTCGPAAASSTQTRANSLTAGSRLLDLNAKASAASAATVGAIKAMTAGPQAGSSRTSAPRAPAPTKSGSQAPNVPNLFSKTDRRAKAERESRRKAMQERAKKGLLSDEEKLILAAEEAQAAGEKDKECVVM